jgi:hypothetical protein
MKMDKAVAVVDAGISGLLVVGLLRTWGAPVVVVKTRRGGWAAASR